MAIERPQSVPPRQSSGRTAEWVEPRVRERRGFLALLGRVGGMAMLIAGGGWLIGRRPGGGSGDGFGGGAASVGNPCGRCGRLFECLLPQAEDARRRGAGLTGPVRRTAGGAPAAEADVGCAEGREIFRKAIDG